MPRSGKGLPRKTPGAGEDEDRLEVFDDFARSWEPVDELDPSEHLVVDTDQPLAASVKRLRSELPITEEET
jgi:hypothetical protein